MDELEEDIRAGIADAIILRTDWSRWSLSLVPLPDRACWQLRVEMDGRPVDLPPDFRPQYLTDDVIQAAHAGPGDSKLRVAARNLTRTLLDLLGS